PAPPRYTRQRAGVAELADAPGLGPGAFGCGGSNPPFRTRRRMLLADLRSASPWPRYLPGGGDPLEPPCRASPDENCRACDENCRACVGLRPTKPAGALDPSDIGGHRQRTGRRHTIPRSPLVVRNQYDNQLARVTARLAGDFPATGASPANRAGRFGRLG